MSKPEVHDLHWINIYFNWSWPGAGFGETSVCKSKEDGHLIVDAECMGKEKARQLLYAAVDKIIDEAEFR